MACLISHRIPRSAARTLAQSRHLHTIRATFVDLNSIGKLERTEHDLDCGEENGRQLLLPKIMGEKFQKISQRVDGVRLGVKLADIRHPLYYYHESKHIAHSSNPTFPRLELSRALTESPSHNGKSAATLWTGGLMDVVTLDGTPEEKFWEMALETFRDLGPAMEKLKDM